jgi:hypothetical protein
MLCPWRQPSRRDAAPVAENSARHTRTQRPAKPATAFEMLKFADVPSKKKKFADADRALLASRQGARSYSCPRTPPTLAARATAPDTPGPCRPQRCHVLGSWPGLGRCPPHPRTVPPTAPTSCYAAAGPTRSHPTA